MPDLKRILAGWKDERSDIERQLAEEEQPAESDGDLDPDVVIEELHYLEEHLESNESLLARAAFRRVFKTVTLYWNHDGGRYRELDRVEVEPHHPFALTENTRIPPRKPRHKPHVLRVTQRRSPTSTHDAVSTGRRSFANEPKSSR